MRKNNIIRVIFSIVAVVGVIMLIGFVLKKNKLKREAMTAVVAEKSDAAVSVRVSEVGKDQLALDFSANGNFAPSQQMNFAAESAGRITSVLVDEGSVVRRGQVIAILKTDALSIDLETAEAAMQNAERDLQRYENAFTTGGVTRQQLDQARLNYENTKARVQQSKIRISDNNIRSTINGIVNKRFVEPGAVVSPGTALFELVDVSKLKLQLTVNETEVASLKQGDKVTVKASVFPDKEFNGVVTFIAPMADKSLNFPIEIEVSQNPGNILKAGMYGTAYFKPGKSAPVVVIPRPAFAGSVSTNQVFVVREDNTAELRKVVAGRVFGDSVEILDGLKEGEKVITSGQINLSDGSKINIIDEKQ